MSYSTYYISSNGQPRNGNAQHPDLKTALDAWVSNTGALIRGSGGRSVLEFEDDTGRTLEWYEHIGGAYATGDLADRLADCDPADVATPEQVAELLRPGA